MSENNHHVEMGRMHQGSHNLGFVDEETVAAGSDIGSPNLRQRSRTSSIGSGHITAFVDAKTTTNTIKAALEDIDEKMEPEQTPYVYVDKELHPTSILDIILEKTGLESKVDLFKTICKYTALIAFHVFIACAIYYHVTEKIDINWCDGLGFILICMILTYIWHASKLLIRMAKQSKAFMSGVSSITGTINDNLLSKTYGRLALHFLTYLGIGLFLFGSSAAVPRRIISACGLFVFILLGVLFSKHPKHIRWRQVTWGVLLQVLLAILILNVQTGKDVLDCLGDKVETFLGYTKAGSIFVYGYLIGRQPFIPDLLPEGSLARNVTMEINEHKAINVVVVFDALSVLFFFNFMVNILFHFGVIQWVTVVIGDALRWTVGTTPCESVNAAANIFLGQAMAPLLIKPFLHKLTHSEIHSIMTGGFSTIAGLVMAAYISFGVSPAHLLGASVMSAPASLAIAKLLYPETEESQTLELEVSIKDAGGQKQKNLLTEATQGAADAAILVLNITALVIACIATIAFANAMTSFFFGLIGQDFVNFEYILGKVFIPLAFILGIDYSECEMVGRLIGIKTVVNEFIAYKELGELIKAQRISERSATIATYALCGFANPGSIGVQIAALSAMCPERKEAFSRVVVRAFVSGLSACFMTACIAGAVSSDPGVESLTIQNA